MKKVKQQRKKVNKGRRYEERGNNGKGGTGYYMVYNVRNIFQ